MDNPYSLMANVFAKFSCCSDPVPQRQIREARVGLYQQGGLFVIQHCTFKLLTPHKPRKYGPPAHLQHVDPTTNLPKSRKSDAKYFAKDAMDRPKKDAC